VYSDPTDIFSGVTASFAVDASATVFSEMQRGIPGVTAVSGVGDEAYFQSAGATLGLLDFRKGNLLFEASLQVAGSESSQFPSATMEGVVKTLASDALTRIP
jgi:hypothetical protein